MHDYDAEKADALQRLAALIETNCRRRTRQERRAAARAAMNGKRRTRKPPRRLSAVDFLDLAEAVDQPYLADGVPEEQRAIDDKSRLSERKAQQIYARGVPENDLPEVMRRMVIDLLDAGHIPSRIMLSLISAELKELWWPGQQTEPACQDFVFLYNVQQLIKYRATEEYGDARGARRWPSRTLRKCTASPSTGCAGSSRASVGVSKSAKPHWCSGASVP